MRTASRRSTVPVPWSGSSGSMLWNLRSCSSPTTRSRAGAARFMPAWRHSSMRSPPTPRPRNQGRPDPPAHAHPAQPGTNPLDEETEMNWLFELDGEAVDKIAVKPLASACNCVIRPGPDAKLWLGGAKFDNVTTTEQALEEARKTLVQLNGLARLENPQHRTVTLGNAFLQDQRLLHIDPCAQSRVLKSEVYEYTSPLT